jgi:hypothetical protein
LTLTGTIWAQFLINKKSRRVLIFIDNIDEPKFRKVSCGERSADLFASEIFGHRTPRKVPMSGKLFEVLSRRHKNRDKNVPWVFWHRYQSSRNGEWAAGPGGNPCIRTGFVSAELTRKRENASLDFRRKIFMVPYMLQHGAGVFTVAPFERIFGDGSSK